MAQDFVVDSPFGTGPLADIHLPRAPLARTLTQIRFPNQSALMVNDAVANEVAHALSVDYPVLNVEQSYDLLLTPDGVERQERNLKVWRVSTQDEVWRVGFSANFLSLETSSYTNREDFSERLSQVWRQFTNVLGHPSVQRVGFRYVNRVHELEFLNTLSTKVRREVLGAAFVGGAKTPLARSLAENLYVLGPQDQLLARWGVLPPGDTIDPLAVPPMQTVSWLLDIDAFRMVSPRSAVDVPEVLGEIRQSAYRFFRWAVTDEFLTYFGGEV